MNFSREFNHRVKSVSMSKFTAEEVTALQAGGNEVCMIMLFFFLLCIKYQATSNFVIKHLTTVHAQRAKQIYFKEWDSVRHAYPDSW